MSPAHRPAAPTRVVWVNLCALYVLWGSTYGANKLMVQSLPPLLTTGGRFLVSAALLAVVAAVRGGGTRCLLPRRSQLAGSCVVGLLLVGAGSGMIISGQRTVPSGLTALIVAGLPLYVASLRVAVGERLGPLGLGGILLGLCGLAMLVLPGGAHVQVSPRGIALVMVGSWFWALGSWLAPRLQAPRDPLVATAWQEVLGGTALLAAGALLGEPRQFQRAEVDPVSWLAVGYLALAGSFAGFALYVWLLRHAPLGVVSTYAYINPVVALLIGTLLLGETVTSLMILGGAIVLASVVVVLTSEHRRMPTAGRVRTP